MQTRLIDCAPIIYRHFRVLQDRDGRIFSRRHLAQIVSFYFRTDFSGDTPGLFQLISRSMPANVIVRACMGRLLSVKEDLLEERGPAGACARRVIDPLTWI